MNIIINADDFGMTKDVNKAIFELCSLGVCTSITVMTNMPFYEEIVSFVPNKTVSIGLHVNLTEGRPVSDPKAVSSLVDNDGMFLSPSVLKRSVRSGIVKKTHVFQEVEAQFDRLYQVIGERIDHFDSHQGTNKLKIVTDSLQDLVQKRKLKIGIRVYNKYYLVGEQAEKRIVHPKPINILEFGLKRILVEMVLRYRTRILEKSFYHPDGLLLTSAHKALNVLKILSDNNINDLSKRTFEIAFHPSTSTNDLPPEMSQSRVDEYNYMKTKEFNKSIKRYNLINYNPINFR